MAKASRPSDRRPVRKQNNGVANNLSEVLIVSLPLLVEAASGISDVHCTPKVAVFGVE